MNKSFGKAVLILLALGVVVPAFAKAPIYQKGGIQMQRIQQGIYSGELTRGEARVLRNEQRNIYRLKKRFLRDGRLSKRERRTLRSRYKKASRHIYRLKHNSRTRYAYRSSPLSPWRNGGYGGFGFIFSQRY